MRRGRERPRGLPCFSFALPLALCCAADAARLPTQHPAWGGHGSRGTQLYALPAACAPLDTLAPFEPTFRPPHHTVIAATPEQLATLPAACRDGAEPVAAERRAHASVHSLSDAERNATGCHELTCPVLHPHSTADAPLITLDVHFVRPPETRASCLRATDGTRPAHCQTPQHHAFAAAAAHDWHGPLRRHLGSDTPLVTEHGGQFSVHVPPGHVPAAVALLTAQPLVATVAAGRARRAASLDYAAAVAQSSTPLAGSGAAAAAQHAFWAAGLAGRGEIIGIGDSGLDMQHCAFSDPAVPFESFSVDEFSVPRFRSDDHRKVALYYMFADNQDDPRGHGSHVAGIAAGAPPGAGSEQRGVAHAARLAFVDLGRTGAQLVSAPYDLGERYFPRTFAVGARVHSDSWGSNVVTYDFDTASLDKFAHDTPAFLSIFSAGNYGRYRTDYNTTVNSPSLAKNTISVGNSLNAGSTVAGSTAASVVNVRFAVETPQATLAFTERVVAADFSAAWAALEGGAAVVVADPADACGELANRGAARGAAVLALRGACDFDSKARAAEAAGAAALIVGNTADEFEVMTRSAPGAAAIPVGMAAAGAFEAVRALLVAGQPVTAAFVGAVDLTNQPSFQSIDSTSSLGPTTDGRIKPDLVAPGSIVSVNGGSDCGYRGGGGTSMSAPVVAGAAAITRQYLAEGFYPGGVRGGGVRHTASGPLVKALLIGGAQPLLGYAGGRAVPIAAPSGVQGWGRVSLADSLPLSSGGTVPNLQFVDLAQMSQQGEEHIYCVNAAASAPLTATLVWHDPAADLSTDGPLLVNDLDLEVRLAALGGLKLHSRGAGAPDRVNNVERVRLEVPPAGQVVLAVRTHRLMSVQGYSLVLQGAFDGLLQGAQNPALNGTADATATCDVLTAVITLAPEPLIADGAPGFAFRTANGASPALGFECQLASSDAGAVAALHGWQACTSPREYAGLRDGAYVFSVRISGQELAESRRFEVDVQPPVTTILPDFGFANTSALAVPLPPASSGAQVAAFAFVTRDRSNATTTCKLTAAAGKSVAPAGPYAPGFATDQEYACASPQVFSVLSPGQYTFEVWGEDAIGNREQTPQAHAFTVAYAAGSVYTRVRGAPWGRTNKLQHALALAAVQGGGGGPVATATFEYASDALTAAGAWQQAAWTPVQGATYNFKAPADGEYRVRLRAAAQGLTAVPATWRFTIDSTPPAIFFNVTPPAIVSSEAVVMRVSSNEEGVAWACALLERNAERVEASALKPCDVGPQGGITYTGLKDGQRYTFALRATDPFGNASPIALRRWLVDATAPVVHGMAAWPAATRARSVTLRFGVTDGPAGTGVRSVECGVRWLGNGPQPDAEWGPCARAAAAATRRRRLLDATPAECEGCVVYEHVLETEDEGRWGFTVRTADAANQTFTSEEAVVVVDRTAPRAVWSPDGAPRNPSPPSLSVPLDTVNSGTYKSDIRGALCALVKPGESHAAPFGEQAAAETVLPAATRAAAEAQGGAFEVVQPGGGALAAAYGVWYECAAPVQLREVASGTYSVRAKPLDAAGNTGAMLQREITVDETLAPDEPVGVGGGGESGVGTRTYGVVGGVAVAAVLLAVLIALWVSRRRRRQRARREAEARAAAAASGPWGAHMAHHGAPGGTAGGGSAPSWRLPAARAGGAAPVDPDADRIQKAIELSMVEAGMQQSRAQTHDETALKLAIEASLNDSGPRR